MINESSELFIGADSNKSEKLSSVEFKHHDKTFKDFKEVHVHNGLGAFDGDTVSKDEIIKAATHELPTAKIDVLSKDMETGFPLVDKNNDGSISKSENNLA